MDTIYLQTENPELLVECPRFIAYGPPVIVNREDISVGRHDFTFFNTLSFSALQDVKAVAEAAGTSLKENAPIALR